MKIDKKQAIALYKKAKEKTIDGAVYVEQKFLKEDKSMFTIGATVVLILLVAALF